MKNFVGNCNHIIDWNAVIASIENQEPAYIGPRHKEGDVKAVGLNEVADVWNKAGYVPAYNGGNAGWDMFFPGHNFDQDVVTKFAEFVGVPGVTNAWIARIRPGYVAPWHWDVTDDETTLSSKKDTIRFHCHIQTPEDSLGHSLILEDEIFYREQQGAVYKWPHRKSWHGASNCGIKPFYTFQFWYCYD